MKQKTKPVKRQSVKTPSTRKRNGNQKNKGGDPRKPGTDPDQTPEREIERIPVADPNADGQ